MLSSYYIEKTKNPNAAQSLALRTLTDLSDRGDTRTVSYPQEEDAVHYLLWTRKPGSAGRELTGALAVLPLDGDTVECIALVRPLARRKGFFTRLLKRARRDFVSFDFLFPVPEGADDVIASLQTIGARHDHTDLMMEYRTAQILPAALIPETLFPEPFFPEVFPWPKGPSEPIGSCRVIPLSPDCVCLCQVEISPASRGLGHGTAMIRHLLDQLSNYGICRVILHVEKENIPAVALYKKTGFRVIETLSYSLLPSAHRADD